MINLGSTVQDRVTKFTGFATARCEYLEGNVRVQVEAGPPNDGKPIEPQWFDEGRLDVLTPTPKPVDNQRASA